VPRQSIDFELQGIAHLLSDKDMHVPTYQRSFAWGSEQFSDYWTDLKRALDEGFAEYFLGTVVLAEDEAGATIIDGQQRLATTTIFLAALRDAYGARNDELRAKGIHDDYIVRFDLDSATDVARLTLNAEDAAFFERAIVEGVPGDPEIDSHRRLLAAQTYLRRRIEEDLAATDAAWSQRIVQWVRFLDEGVKIMTIVVPEVSDAFVIFETLNDRGAPLTISDLLRNYLMAQARDQEGLEAVQDAWGQVLLNLGLQQEENVFVDFLRQWWSSKHGAVREKELFASIRARVAKRDAALALAAELPEASRFYAALLDSQHELWSEYQPEASASIEALIRLELGQYRPLALAVLQHFSKPEQVRTLRALVSWAVRGLVVGGVGGGVSERAYCVAATKVRSGDLKSAEDLLRQLLPIVPSDEDFGGAFFRARVSRAGVARYVMTALERDARDLANPEIVEPGFDAGVRLQYVLPKSAGSEHWAGVEPEDVKGLVTRVGNLVTLSAEDGDLVGRVTFEERREVFAKSTVTLTRAVERFDRWNAETIDERQADLAERALVVWPRTPAQV
jgi:hypothetical protein